MSAASNAVQANEGAVRPCEQTKKRPSALRVSFISFLPKLETYLGVMGEEGHEDVSKELLEHEQRVSIEHAEIEVSRH